MRCTITFDDLGHDGGGGEDELDDDYGYYGTGEEEHDDHLISAPVPDT